MSTKGDVLALLNQSENISLSGEEIAKKLSISRSAVWKAIRSLRSDGYGIVASTNRGYRLEKGNDILSAPAIKSMLDNAKEYEIISLEQIDSTNSYLKKAASEGAKDGTVVIAESQTNGRGRLGRRFVSQSGGLYMSLLIRPELSAEKSLFITTATAVAVCRAIEKVTDKNVGIKWVNDIFLNGKKVCGILTEGASDFESGRLEYAVIGIGLNIVEPVGGFDSEIRDIATSLFGEGAPSGTKNALAAAILNELSVLLKNPYGKETADEYRRRSIVIGKEVDINHNDSIARAIIIDIDDNAAIVLKTDDGKIIKKTSGEISIRI